MRILHTGDWHVGRTIRGRSRADEHVAVLAEVAAIARDEAVDLVLVAGDLFDTAAPSPEAERTVYRTLLDLAAVAPVVAIAGNHDSPERLAAVTPLLAASRVVTGARVARPDDGGVVDVEVASGQTARVALLPWPSRRGVVRAEDLLTRDAADHQGVYADRVARILDALAASFDAGVVNVVLAHLTMVGASTAGSERAVHTVVDYAVPGTRLPAAAHYVALGHFHRAQVVPAAVPARYAGSPLALDFGEAGQAKSVTVVEAAPGVPASTRTVPLTAGLGLRTVRGTLPVLEAGAGDHVPGADHVRVVVVGEAVAGLADTVRGWYPDAVEVVVERAAADVAATTRSDRLAGSPQDLFAAYLAERGKDDQRVRSLFARLLEDEQAGDAQPGAAAAAPRP